MKPALVDQGGTVAGRGAEGGEGACCVRAIGRLGSESRGRQDRKQRRTASHGSGRVADRYGIISRVSRLNIAEGQSRTSGAPEVGALELPLIAQRRCA